MSLTISSRGHKLLLITVLDEGDVWWWCPKCGVLAFGTYVEEGPVEWFPVGTTGYTPDGTLLDGLPQEPECRE